MIERTHLEIIHSLNQLGTLTRVARALKLSQSALSHSIAKLEDQLECSIWRKKGRGLVLTDQGQMILGMAKKILPMLQKAEAELKQSGDGRIKGYLRIGMECYPCYQWLSSLLPQFLRDWPTVDLDIRQKFKFGAVGALIDHDIDMIITPDPYFREGLSYEAVFPYELVAVVGHDHSLDEKAFIEPEDLRDETLITYPIPKERLDIFTKFLLPADISPGSYKTFETTEMIVQMVSAGRGIAVLPDWLVREYQSKAMLRPLRIGRDGIYKTNHIGFRTDDESVGYIRDFINLAKHIWSN
ncbi:LysR family transcriptional regulator [Pseudobacteriovorax antillogorgiicola]|uniref:HTH-type transcriptional regulator MetR n=1 Tax=Pseudobacteriovorax antillogorgiicola TaxID=1513793 RepID=A0A1Y6BNA0_9BACT|nr:LysR family transcriptional regulator [Pseudobacteriovorax antillogorgiicola]TCS54681.1 LysR family transcriptional regulator for metE and metH [Pseudobacteriovorax antillogorgiicola]SMF16586.1 LysR family transcriptional regulator, regulator for metE and metH [Pseudobacteriovorax antillogorgiicola]